MNLCHCFHYNLLYRGAFKRRCKNLTLSWNLLKSFWSKERHFSLQEHLLRLLVLLFWISCSRSAALFSQINFDALGNWCLFCFTPQLPWILVLNRVFKFLIQAQCKNMCSLISYWVFKYVTVCMLPVYMYTFPPKQMQILMVLIYIANMWQLQNFP